MITLHFIILSLDQSLSVSSPVLQVEDFQFLIHRGFVATIFISANNISEARQSLSQNNPSAIIQNYAESSFKGYSKLLIMPFKILSSLLL